MSTTESNRLLRDYAQHGNETAFGELVTQYIDLVYSTAVRRLGGNAELAREVTQTVFTDLARKAASLGNNVMLGGWLHRHTGFVSASVVRSERRRRAREQQAAEMNTLHLTPDPTWQQLAPIVDETVDSLEPPDRQAIILRFYERRDLRAVGVALGISEDAAQKRVSRALGKLRALLISHGVELSLSVLASELATKAVGAAPAGLATGITRTAVAGAAAGAGTAVALVKAISPNLAKCGMALAVGAVVWTGVLAARHSATHIRRLAAGSASGTTSLAAAVGTNRDARVQAATGLAEAPTNTNILMLHIVDAESGEPVNGATVEREITERRNGAATQRGSFQVISTPRGECAIPLPEQRAGLMTVRSRTDGFEDTTLAWLLDREKVPAEYTFRLARSVRIGGIVLNEDGLPIAGAEVQVGRGGETGPGVPHITNQAAETTMTDADGRWRIDRFSKDAIAPKDAGSARLTFRAIHPDYLEDVGFTYGSPVPPEIETQLLEGTFVIRLARRASLQGTVTDANGQPVPNVSIVVTNPHVPRGANTVTNQPDGRFAIEGCRAGANLITFEAGGFRLQKQEVDLRPDMAPLRVRLSAARPLRLRIVDATGAPVSNASVTYETFVAGGRPPSGARGIRNPTTLAAGFRQTTDAEGRVRWDSPPEGNFSLKVAASGLRTTNAWMKADENERVIALAPALTVLGGVRDAATGEPVKAFTVMLGGSFIDSVTRQRSIVWGRSSDFRDGKFRYMDDGEVLGKMVLFRFEAEGYVPFVTQEVAANAGEVQLDVQMQPGTARPIKVLRPDGAPATNAAVAVVSPGGRVVLTEGKLRPSGAGSKGGAISTDDQGHVSLPPTEAGTRVVATTEDGFAVVLTSSLAADPKVQLQAWGQLEGQVLFRGQGMPGVVLRLDAKEGPLLTLEQVRTDANGHFSYPKVPAGTFILSQKGSGPRHPGLRKLAEVTMGAGETKTIKVDAETK